MKGRLPKEKKQLRYVTAHEQIKAIIEEEGLEPGDRLPSENDLASRLRVSRGTLRQALMLLRENGVIYNHQGKGNFLCAAGQNSAGLERAGCDLLHFAAVPVEKRSLTVGYVPSTKTVQEYLGREETILLARFQILYHNTDGVIAYRIAFIPYELLEERRVGLDSEEELLDFVDECLQVWVTSASLSIDHVEARQSVAEQMNAKLNTPLLCLTEVGRDKTGAAISYSKFYCCPEYFKFVINRE